MWPGRRSWKRPYYGRGCRPTWASRARRGRLPRARRRRRRNKTGAGVSSLFYVVAVEVVLLAQVKAPVGDHGWRPGGVRSARDFEARFLRVGFRRGLNQTDSAVFAHAIEALVGVRAVAFADAAVAPCHLAGHPLHGGEDGAGVAVQVVAHQHAGSVVVAHVFIEIDLGRLHSATLRREFQEGATGAVVGGNEDVVLVDDGRGDIGGAVGDIGVAPQQFAVFHIQPDSGAGGEDGQAAGCAGIERDRRGIARAIALRLPDDRTGGFVQGDDGRAGSAGGDDHPVAF